MPSTRTVGDLGESLACAALERRGYQIVERNWRPRLWDTRGEIDIVARDGDCWAFVEVKTRRGHRTGLPEEAMTPRKLATVTELAQAYLYERSLGNVNWRVDLVAIELDGRGRVRRLNIVPALALE
ncbi:MAG: YraN family protein [Chloroflexi bacterium]|nr:YraN family protein [Chloroflexota bacterium]